MNKIVLIIFYTTVLSQVFALSDKFRLDVEIQQTNDVDKVFEKTRSLLKPEERELLEEILAADEVIMERQKRGIVDQILASISGVAGNFIVGSPSQNQNPATAAPAQVVQQPTAAPKSDITTAATATCISNCNTRAPSAPAAPAPAQQPPATAAQQQPAQNNDNHLFNQISRVVINSGTRNVTGIVDEALKIGTPAPVRDLVNGILGVAYCNGIRRLLGRC